MVEIPAQQIAEMQQIITWGVNGATILLLIIAGATAIKRKNMICLNFIIFGNLLAYYFTHSPLLCMIISIAGIIWAIASKRKEENKEVVREKSANNVKDLKTSKTINIVSKEDKKVVKPGPIIGLILGILMAGSAAAGMLMGEASLSDPKGKMIGIGFLIFGAFMVIVNIIVLVTGKENLLKSDSEVKTQPTKIIERREEPEEKEEDEEFEEKRKVRCRFCKKLYSAEYNGCPYCKKK